MSEGLEPIPMRLRCEVCGALHVDEGEFATKPHHTHVCQECGAEWRPALVCTVGVRFLPGHGPHSDQLITDLKKMTEQVRTLTESIAGLGGGSSG